MIPYIMAILALALIAAEFYLPGMVLGIIGAILLLTSYFLLVDQGASSLEVASFIGISLIALAFMIRYLLWAIPREKGRGIYLSGDQEGYVSSSYDKLAIGKTAYVLTDLKPGGFIEIDNVSHPAISVSGYIEKGQPVKVLSGEGDSLLVQKISPELQP